MLGSAQAAFYSGVGFGVRPLSANFSKFTVLGVQVVNLNESVTKPAVNLFIGYDHVFASGFYLGTEAFYEYMNMQTSVGTTIDILGTDVKENVSASLNYNVGISALLGYQTHGGDIFYSRVGVIFDELHYKASQEVTNITSTSVKGQHYAGAVQLGVGIIHPFTKHISIRGEYTYTRYPNIAVDIPITVPTVGTGHVRFTPQVSINAATASLIYSF